jgi:hypothetical protein
MKEVYGFFIALFSTLAAGLVSGLRLRPYIEAGAVYTPPTFMLYPGLTALALTVLSVFFLYTWGGKKVVTIGPASFTHRQFFAALWSLSYIVIAVGIFPYQPPESRPTAESLQRAEGLPRAPASDPYRSTF